jgi:protein-tyrosine phosphatase
MTGPDFDRIEDSLYMGSKPDPNLNYKELGFDVMVFCAKEHQPNGETFPGMTVVRIPLDDPESFTDVDLKSAMAKALQGAQIVRSKLDEGQRVLVTCMQGRNRSGVVSALTLWLNKRRPGWYCVERVRQRRRSNLGPVLSNAGYTSALLLLGPLA